MKKFFSVLMMVIVFGTFAATAQNTEYTVKSSADCTNLKTEFTIPSGKVAKLISMEIVTSFTTCNASESAPTSNFARVYVKTNSDSKSKGTPLYKKTVSSDGTVTESCPIQDVKLNPGTYTLEVSKAPNLEAKLTVLIK